MSPFPVVSVRLAAALAITISMTGGCTHRVEGSASTEAPTVAVAKASRGDIKQTLAVASEFRPFQEVEVHAKIAGYLKSINVDVGDRVRAGALLAVLENPEIEDEIQRDDATVKRAQEEIRRAQSDLDRAESVYAVAHLAGQRLSGVVKVRPGLVAQQDVDDANGRDRVAEAQVETAKAALASAGEQAAIARASRQKNQTLLAYSRITAPFAGVITHRYADTGAMIQAGTSSQTQAMPVVTLSENSRLRLVIPVPESAVSRVQLGRAVGLEVQALHKTFQGTVARFANRLDTETRTMHVEVDVPNPTLELVPGMYAEASITLGEATNVVTVPLEALDRTADGSRVLIVDQDHRVAVRDVTLGLEDGDRAEIVSGLAVDDLVVVGSRSQLKPGTTVTPKLTVAATAPEAAQ